MYKKCIRFGKKEQSDPSRVTAKKNYWNLKYQIPDPIFPYVWVEFCEHWDKLKFWIGRSTLATCSGNNWPRLKSPTINILCCVGSSLINKIKSPMKEAIEPCIRYTTTNKKSLPFYFQYNWQYLQNTENINYFGYVYFTHVVT